MEKDIMKKLIKEQTIKEFERKGLTKLAKMKKEELKKLKEGE